MQLLLFLMGTVVTASSLAFYFKLLGQILVQNMFMMVFYKEKIGLQKDEEENLVTYLIFLYYSYLKSYPNQNPIVDFERLLTPKPFIMLFNDPLNSLSEYI